MNFYINFFFRNVVDKVLIKEDKQKLELENSEKEEDNTEEENKDVHKKNLNSGGKNPPTKSPAMKNSVKFKSESSKGVVDLSNVKKQPREFNNKSTSVKKNGLSSTNSNGTVNKKK